MNRLRSICLFDGPMSERTALSPKKEARKVSRPRRYAFPAAILRITSGLCRGCSALGYRAAFRRAEVDAMSTHGT